MTLSRRLRLGFHRFGPGDFGQFAGRREFPFWQSENEPFKKLESSQKRKRHLLEVATCFSREQPWRKFKVSFDLSSITSGAASLTHTSASEPKAPNIVLHVQREAHVKNCSPHKPSLNQTRNPENSSAATGFLLPARDYEPVCVRVWACVCVLAVGLCVLLAWGLTVGVQTVSCCKSHNAKQVHWQPCLH